MFTKLVVVRRDGAVIEQDYAAGNTRRTATAAADAMRRQLADIYPVHDGYLISVGPTKETTP